MKWVFALLGLLGAFFSLSAQDVAIPMAEAICEKVQQIPQNVDAEGFDKAMHEIYAQIVPQFEAQLKEEEAFLQKKRGGVEQWQFNRYHFGMYLQICPELRAFNKKFHPYLSDQPEKQKQYQQTEELVWAMMDEEALSDLEPYFEPELWLQKDFQQSLKKMARDITRYKEVGSHSIVSVGNGPYIFRWRMWDYYTDKPLIWVDFIFDDWDNVQIDQVALTRKSAYRKSERKRLRKFEKSNPLEGLSLPPPPPPSNN